MESSKKTPKQAGVLSSKKGLRASISTLKDTAKQFRKLEREAKVLLSKKDADGYSDKLRKRALLLVDLPDRLACTLNAVDKETAQTILSDVFYFKESAKKALDGGIFSLGVLLRQKGDRSDKNDLEKLIQSLEEK